MFANLPNLSLYGAAITFPRFTMWPGYTFPVVLSLYVIFKSLLHFPFVISCILLESWWFCVVVFCIVYCVSLCTFRHNACHNLGL